MYSWSGTIAGDTLGVAVVPLRLLTLWPLPRVNSSSSVGVAPGATSSSLPTPAMIDTLSASATLPSLCSPGAPVGLPSGPTWVPSARSTLRCLPPLMTLASRSLCCPPSVAPSRSGSAWAWPGAWS